MPGRWRLGTDSLSARLTAFGNRHATRPSSRPSTDTSRSRCPQTVSHRSVVCRTHRRRRVNCKATLQPPPLQSPLQPNDDLPKAELD